MTSTSEMTRHPDSALKSRALRKYEADVGPFDGSSGRRMEVISPLGPLIGRSRVSSEIIERLNVFSDRQGGSTRHSAKA